MQDEDYELIERQIGYKFKNRALLRQAFTRKSYTAETRKGENNEVLEFIGDKVLDIIVVKTLSRRFGKINDCNEYKSEYSEGKLSEIKKTFVESKMLSSRIESLGFEKFLIMGKGDIKIGAQNDMHVKEDLFEAILGAVAIDSDWDMQSMEDAVEMMLNPESYIDNGFHEVFDYVAAIQQWQQKKDGKLPDYRYCDKNDYTPCESLSAQRKNERKRLEFGFGNTVCELRIDDGEPFVGYGKSKSQARVNAAKLAYNYLEKEKLLHTISDDIDKPSLERAVGQLQELAQKDYISLPVYDFTENYDDNGNPAWTCYCSVKEFGDTYTETCGSKKEAKRSVAYRMLLHVLETKIEAV